MSLVEVPEGSLMISTESPSSGTNERAKGSTQVHGKPLSPGMQRQFVVVPKSQQQQHASSGDLHLYTRPLTVSDLDSCVELENSAFTDPRDRATKEKFIYRLSKCGELCLGIFCTVVPGSEFYAETLSTSRRVDLIQNNAALSVLLGHIVAAKTNDMVATDESMAIPSDWQSASPKFTETGHQEGGRTIVLHSVAIVPALQRRGIGKVLMSAYMQQMKSAGIADRLALISHDHNVSWYEKLGFVNKGQGKSQFGGGGWTDMVYELSNAAGTANG